MSFSSEAASLDFLRRITQQQEPKEPIIKTIKTVKTECERLRLFELLGKGAYGSVYEGCLDPCNLKYATKIFKNINDPDVESAFKKEVSIAKIAGEIGVSPNVSADLICKKNNKQEGYLFSERWDNSLDKYPWCGWDKNNIYKILESLLLQLHKKRIVHGDISPRNILVRRNKKSDMQFALTDYGLSFYTNDNNTKLFTITKWKNYLNKSKQIKSNKLKKLISEWTDNPESLDFWLLDQMFQDCA